MAKKTFNINVEMEERWVDDFCSMLYWMQSCGNLGHSSLIGFYSDGDGDFRPRFDIGTEYELKDGFRKDEINNCRIEVLYDAG